MYLAEHPAAADAALATTTAPAVAASAAADMRAILRLIDSPYIDGLEIEVQLPSVLPLHLVKAIVGRVPVYLVSGWSPP
ncbi:hypothetical protein GCM10018962_71770 [Dactylosporangium matsuzakiense]